MDYVGGHADLHHSLQDRRVQPGKPYVNIKTLTAFYSLERASQKARFVCCLRKTIQKNSNLIKTSWGNVMVFSIFLLMWEAYKIIERHHDLEKGNPEEAEQGQNEEKWLIVVKSHLG